MPIYMAELGEEYTIKAIRGKEEDDVKRHLYELGFVVGMTVKPVTKIQGNLIVQIKESRIAIDKTMASRIMV